MGETVYSYTINKVIISKYNMVKMQRMYVPKRYY